MGTYVLDRYIDYLKDIGAYVLPTLDPSWQITYYARIEAMRLREAHEKEASLGFAKVTKASYSCWPKKKNTCFDKNQTWWLWCQPNGRG